MRALLVRILSILAVAAGFAAAGIAIPSAHAWLWTDGPAETRSSKDSRAVRQVPRSAPKQHRDRAANTMESPVEQAEPARVSFTADEQWLAHIPGFEGVRFWADSVADFEKALPSAAGAWLVLSSGGPDGGYGAGFLAGWSIAGSRPEFTVVTGVGTGALTAVLAFAGPDYNTTLEKFFTNVSAGNVFEARATKESEVDTAPLKREIARVITDRLVADVAAQHERGRRLFVMTTNLDAGRPVIWNLGALAAGRDDRAVQLFRTVIMAATSIPGKFPPAYLEVEANGRRFAEMHVDGSVSSLTYLAPDSYLFLGSNKRVPMTRLYVVLNGKATPQFALLNNVSSDILSRSISIVRRANARTELALLSQAAALAEAEFSLALIDSDFEHAATAPVDPKYMNAVFKRGFRAGKALQFAQELPFAAGRAHISHVSEERAFAK